MHSHLPDVKPLLLAVGAFSLIEINQVLGTVSIFVSISYTAYKFYKENNNKK